MRCWLLSLLILGPLSAFAQTSNADLPAAPMPSSASLTLATADANASLSQSQAASPNRQQPLIDPATATISITRTDAEGLALKNNPRVTASHLLALAAGQVTRETRSGELPHRFRSHAQSRREQQAATESTGPDRTRYRAGCFVGDGPGLLPTAECTISARCSQSNRRRTWRCTKPYLRTD